MDIESIAAYALATILQLPYQIVLGLPWLLVAWLIWRFGPKFRNSYMRLAGPTGLVAIGLAPVYGFHASMMPVYLYLLMVDSSDWKLVIVSVGITWLVIFGSLAIVMAMQAKTPNAI